MDCTLGTLPFAAARCTCAGTVVELNDAFRALAPRLVPGGPVTNAFAHGPESDTEAFEASASAACALFGVLRLEGRSRAAGAVVPVGDGVLWCVFEDEGGILLGPEAFLHFPANLSARSQYLAVFSGTDPVFIDERLPAVLGDAATEIARAAVDRAAGAVGRSDSRLRIDGAAGERVIWERAIVCRRAGEVGLTVAAFVDLSDLAEFERAQASQGQWLDHLADSLADVLYTARVRGDGRELDCVHLRGDVARLFGGPLTAAEFAVRYFDLVHPVDRALVAAGERDLVAGTAIEQEYRIVRLDGEERWVLDRAYPRVDVDGLRWADGLLVDITDRKRLEIELEAARAHAEQLARTDVLTGLLNRRAMQEAIAVELERARREGSTPGLALIDVDHFKAVNDRHGHAGGDAVLVEVAQRLAGAVRPYDIVARWGGEEFAVLFPAIPDDTTLRVVAEGLRAAVGASDVTVGGRALRLTCSAGAVRCSAPHMDADEVMRAADRALYRAKRLGRDRLSLSRALASAS